MNEGEKTESGRTKPDISTSADPQPGILIALSQLFPDGVRTYRFGGTGMIAPLMASAMAATSSLKHEACDGGCGESCECKSPTQAPDKSVGDCCGGGGCCREGSDDVESDPKALS